MCPNSTWLGAVTVLRGQMDRRSPSQVATHGGDRRRLTHLFGVYDAFDVFTEDRVHAEEAGQRRQAQQSLPVPHLHLSLSPAGARLLSGPPEAWLGAGARTEGESGVREEPGVRAHVGGSLPPAPIEAAVYMGDARSRFGARALKTPSVIGIVFPIRDHKALMEDDTRTQQPPPMSPALHWTRLYLSRGVWSGIMSRGCSSSYIDGLYERF